MPKLRDPGAGGPVSAESLYRKFLFYGAGITDPAAQKRLWKQEQERRQRIAELGKAKAKEAAGKKRPPARPKPAPPAGGETA